MKAACLKELAYLVLRRWESARSAELHYQKSPIEWKLDCKSSFYHYCSAATQYGNRPVAGSIMKQVEATVCLIFERQRQEWFVYVCVCCPAMRVWGPSTQDWVRTVMKASLPFPFPQMLDAVSRILHYIQNAHPIPFQPKICKSPRFCVARPPSQNVWPCGVQMMLVMLIRSLPRLRSGFWDPIPPPPDPDPYLACTGCT